MEPIRSITGLIFDLRAGQSKAATDLWQKYHERLLLLAAQKLHFALRRVADEEDIVIDAFDSFCRGAKEGRFPSLNDRHDLWQILVMLTARKAANQVKHFNRRKRGGGRVRGDSIFMMNDEERAGIDSIVGSEPTPEFSVQVVEEFHRLLALLPDKSLRDVALAKLDGYSNAEIGQRLKIVERTVERKLHLIRQIWDSSREPEG